MAFPAASLRACSTATRADATRADGVAASWLGGLTAQQALAWGLIALYVAGMSLTHATDSRQTDTDTVLNFGIHASFAYSIFHGVAYCTWWAADAAWVQTRMRLGLLVWISERVSVYDEYDMLPDMGVGKGILGQLGSCSCSTRVLLVSQGKCLRHSGQRCGIQEN